MTGPDPGHAAPPASAAAAGLAHVAGLSFLVSRAAPWGAFALALAGGTALARAGERFGARRAYGVSLAAMIQTVAYLGPARLNGPLTQALTAPMMGALERRGVGRLGQFVACALGRIAHNALVSAFFIFVLLGGLDAYAGTYERSLGRIALLPSGEGAALVFTGLAILAWGLLASAIQVHFYRRGLRRWPASPVEPRSEAEVEDAPPGRGRFDPRAVALATVLAFGLLLTSTEPLLLAGVAAWLALAWALSRPDREAGPAGVALAIVLGASALFFSAVGGLGWAVALRRGARATLLVLVATWLRAAAGSFGIREVARRSLTRLRGLPAVAEAAAVLDELGAGARLRASGSALIDELRAARKRPLAMVDAVLTWVAGESGRFRRLRVDAPAELRLSVTDALLVLAAVAPAAALLAR